MSDQADADYERDMRGTARDIRSMLEAPGEDIIVRVPFGEYRLLARAARRRNIEPEDLAAKLLRGSPRYEFMLLCEAFPAMRLVIRHPIRMIRMARLQRELKGWLARLN